MLLAETWIKFRICSGASWKKRPGQMLIRPQPCASGFVLEAHWKSFHSSVQIQWVSYTCKPALDKWAAFLNPDSGTARWTSLTTGQANQVQNGSQKFSSLPNKQCLLSSLHLIWSVVRCMCPCLRVCMHAHASVVAFLSERGQHNVSYFSLISICVLRASDRAALNIPIIL